MNEKQLAENLFGGNQQSMGATQAGLTGIVEGLKAFADGIGKAFDAVQASPAINDMANHGRSELAAALFSGGGSPYVMYQRGSQHDQPSLGAADQPDQGLDKGMQQDAQKQQMGGKGMSM